MWISGTFRKHPCPVPPCSGNLCQGHDGHGRVEENGDTATFYQLHLDQTAEGVFRVRSQHPYVGDMDMYMEFTIGQPIIYDFIFNLEEKMTAEHAEDGMVFIPDDAQWKMSFVFDTQQQLTLRLEKFGLTMTLTYILV